MVMGDREFMINFIKHLSVSQRKEFTRCVTKLESGAKDHSLELARCKREVVDRAGQLPQVSSIKYQADSEDPMLSGSNDAR
jgi:hypothetical protein